MADMEPHARVARCFFQWERISMELCGHGFIRKPFKPNFITYFVYSLVVIAIFGSVYTIIFYDMSSKLFCALLLLMMFQVRFEMIWFCSSSLKFSRTFFFRRFRPSVKYTTSALKTSICGVWISSKICTMFTQKRNRKHVPNISGNSQCSRNFCSNFCHSCCCWPKFSFSLCRFMCMSWKIDWFHSFHFTCRASMKPPPPDTCCYFSYIPHKFWWVSLAFWHLNFYWKSLW